jgi:hypothetical protein
LEGVEVDQVERVDAAVTVTVTMKETEKMQRLTSVWTRPLGRGRMVATLVSVVLLSVLAPTGALAASFAPTIGFDPNTLPDPALVIGASDAWLSAGDPSLPQALDVEISGSTNVCILIGSSTTCDAGVDQGTAGPISFLVSLTVTAVNTSLITGPFTLLLSDLSAVQGYARSDVTIDLAPDAIPGLDTSATPGFIWDPNTGVNGFSPFYVVEDEINAATTGLQYYIGWMVSVGDTVTYKFDLADGAVIRQDIPGLTANAITVIPEPGTALLIGVGLAGLGLSRRRA